jgi:hypothetical protein
VSSHTENETSVHQNVIGQFIAGLGDHPKAAIDYHFKTGHTETA